MPKEPKHHYIPIFYLQQWAGEDGRLVEFCRRYEGVAARPTFPSGTGYVRGLYRLPGSPPGEEHIIETKLMSNIDNWAAKALRRMMTVGSAPGKLPEREGLGWCQFLYSLIVRNPEHLLRIKEKLNTLDPGEILENVRDDYPNIRGSNDPATFDKYKETFLKNPVDMSAVRVLPELVRSKRVVGLLASFKWGTHTVRWACPGFVER